MTIDTNDLAKKVVHDKLESQIKTAAAKLDTLKAQAETAKANLEIKAIAELSPKALVIRQKFQELKQSGGAQWEQAKSRFGSAARGLREFCEGNRIEGQGEGKLRCDRAGNANCRIEESAAFVRGDGEEGCDES